MTKIINHLNFMPAWISHPTKQKLIRRVVL